VLGALSVFLEISKMDPYNDAFIIRVLDVILGESAEIEVFTREAVYCLASCLPGHYDDGGYETTKTESTLHRGHEYSRLVATSPGDPRRP
jgi:hypothetical protein